MDPLTDEAEPKAALAAAVAEGWRAFGKGRLSRQLEVCTCNVCMTEDDRVAMIRTPVAEMPARLICEYTNAAHLVPENRDDLWALLPRYMELIAAGEAVDHLTIGTELRRFGLARAAGPALSAAQAAAYAEWARALLAAWPVAPRDYKRDAALLYPMTMLLGGGIAMEELAPQMDALLADQARLGGFADAVIWACRRPYELRNYPLKMAPEPTRAAFLRWIRSPLMDERLELLACEPGAPFETTEAARLMLERLPQLQLEPPAPDK